MMTQGLMLLLCVLILTTASGCYIYSEPAPVAVGAGYYGHYQRPWRHHHSHHGWQRW